MTQKYLEAVDDDLDFRESGDYAKDKLTILDGYINRFTTAMKDKEWRSLNYIDLQAGPGKNRFSPSADIMLGSPLLALSTRFCFDKLFFVEINPQAFYALQARVAASDQGDRVTLFDGDCNIAVDKIVADIKQMDKQFLEGKWPCLNLAFLDPEGLEVEWKTVEKLASLKRMDLIINFSTSGITRYAGQAVEHKGDQIIDKFFGTQEWRPIYERYRHRDNSVIRRELIDFYLSRLTDKGYVNTDRQELEFKNRRNVQIYTMIFASKHELGIRFWNSAVQDVSQLSLM